MSARMPVFIALSCLCSPLFADDPATGPVIGSDGPTFAIAALDVPLRPGFYYKVAFDLANYPAGPAAANQGLVSVARFLNMHARHGVRPDNIEIAVVLHGDALKSALTDTAYRSRYSTGNANRELLLQLQAAGVRFFACGQSMGFRGFHDEELLAPVEVALSAMTMLTYLQADGFAVLP